MQETLSFLRLRWPSALLAAVLLAVAAYSFLNLVTTPRLWIDEALAIEMSRNVAERGVLDIQVAPGEFSGTPQYLQSTGYTVTYPLALVFSVFGEGAVQARTYMVVWLLLALLMTYLVVRSLFGTAYALGAVLLLGSFASLYANGRTVTGEAPGFFFLMAGMYFLLARRMPLMAGFLGGLAIVTKPSNYLLLIPAIFLAELLQSQEPWIARARTLVWAGVGALGAVLVWVAVVVPDTGSPDIFANLAAFYRNPYGEGVSPSLLGNLTSSLHSTTVIYFGLLLGLIAAARLHTKDTGQIFFYTFVMLYSLFAFIYYLHSPGWLRYIFAAELLILALIPHAVGTLANAYRHFWPKIVWGKEVMLAIVLLVLVQLVQLSFLSDMLSSGRAVRVAAYINAHEPQVSVLAFQALDVSALLATQQRYNSVVLTGLPSLDTNPLRAGALPGLVVGMSDNPHIMESKNVLDRFYRLQMSDEGLLVYKLISR